MFSSDPAVLIVEPAPQIRARLHRELTALGHSVTAVTSVQAAGCLHEPAPNGLLVLMDVGLAQAGGLAWVRAQANAAAASPRSVILLLDEFSGAMQEAFGAPDVVDAVGKRCTAGELEARVRRAIKLASSGAGALRPGESGITAERPLQTVFDAIPFLLYIKDTRLRFQVLNRAYADFFGASIGSALGRTHAELAGRSRDETERVRESEQKVLCSGAPVKTTDVLWKNANGEPRSLWQIILPLRDAQDRIVGVLGMMEDNTERKRFHEKLRQSEATLREAQRIAHIANWTWDLQTGTVDWCEEIYHIFHLDPARTAPSMETLLSFVHPADQQAVRTAVRRAIADRRPYQSDHRIVLPDGRERNVHDQGHVTYDAEDRPVRMLGVVMDVTERTLAEQDRTRLVTAVEQAGDAIFITDTAGTIQYANHAFERITGYGRDEARGKRPNILKSGLQDAAFYRKLWEALVRGETWHGRYVNRRKDGSLYSVHATITPVRNEKGETTHYVSVHRDISDILQMEQQLRRAQRIEAIATLTGGIAHDFNNILTPIIGFTQLTLGLVPPESEAYQNLVLVRAAAERARQLVAQIRHFSQERGQELTIIHVPALCHEVLTLIRSTVSKAINIVETSAQNLPPVYGDAGLLHRVLTNLCVNACQSMPDGGTLSVHVERTDLTDPTAYLGTPAAGSYVLIRVKDTGFGMDEDTKARLFEPYFTTKESGTGLGLYSAYGIVKQHGGGIRVVSQPGAGASFEVILPVTDARQIGRREDPSDLARGSERILFVDDEEAVTTLAKAALEPLGYRVSTFNGGQRALAQFHATPDDFDLVITDLSMPQVSGEALIAEIRRQRPLLPVVLCTGLCDADTAARMRDLGVNEIVRKPFDLLELPKLIRRLVGQSPLGASADPVARAES